MRPKVFALGLLVVGSISLHVSPTRAECDLLIDHNVEVLALDGEADYFLAASFNAPNRRADPSEFSFAVRSYDTNILSSDDVEITPLVQDGTQLNFSVGLDFNKRVGKTQLALSIFYRNRRQPFCETSIDVLVAGVSVQCISSLASGIEALASGIQAHRVNAAELDETASLSCSIQIQPLANTAPIEADLSVAVDHGGHLLNLFSRQGSKMDLDIDKRQSGSLRLKLEWPGFTANTDFEDQYYTNVVNIEVMGRPDPVVTDLHPVRPFSRNGGEHISMIVSNIMPDAALEDFVLEIGGRALRPLSIQTVGGDVLITFLTEPGSGQQIPWQARFKSQKLVDETKSRLINYENTETGDLTLPELSSGLNVPKESVPNDSASFLATLSATASSLRDVESNASFVVSIVENLHQLSFARVAQYAENPDLLQLSDMIRTTARTNNSRMLGERNVGILIQSYVKVQRILEERQSEHRHDQLAPLLDINKHLSALSRSKLSAGVEQGVSGHADWTNSYTELVEMAARGSAVGRQCGYRSLAEQDELRMDVFVVCRTAAFPTFSHEDMNFALDTQQLSLGEKAVFVIAWIPSYIPYPRPSSFERNSRRVISINAFTDQTEHGRFEGRLLAKIDGRRNGLELFRYEHKETDANVTKRSYTIDRHLSMDGNHLYDSVTVPGLYGLHYSERSLEVHGRGLAANLLILGAVAVFGTGGMMALRSSRPVGFSGGAIG